MTGGSPKSRGALEVILFEEARFRGSLMFTSAEVTVGSAPGIMVRLDDPGISPCHAVLHFDGESCTVENFDPVQGTLVNGAAVDRQAVAATDEIQVGRFRLRITVHSADATPAPVSLRPPARAASQSPASPNASPAKVVPLPIPPPTPPKVAAPPPVQKRPPAVPPASMEKQQASPVPAGRPAPAPMRPQPPVAAKKPDAVVPPPAPPAPAVAPSRPRPAPATAQARPAPESPVGAGPTVLAVAQPVPDPQVAPRSAPAAKPPRATLSAVPTEPSTAAASRSSTRPIASRFAHAPADSAPLGAMLDVDTEPSSMPPASGTIPVIVDDDDDDDAFFEPSFSLLDKLRASGAQSHHDSAVEVVRFRQGCVLKLRHLRRGEKLRLHGLRKPLGRRSKSGDFTFRRDALPESLAVTRSGEPIDESAWRENADKQGLIQLDPATQIIFPLPSGEGVLVHLVPAAAPLPKRGWRPRLDKLLLVLGGVSVLVHMVVFIALGVASLVKRDYIADNKEGRFARIALKEIELEPPAPPPKREKKKAKAEPTQVATAEPQPRNIPHIPRTRTPSTPQTQSAATAQKLLSALGGISAGPKAMSATAMSNLAAVGPVKGGGFKVSGAIGALPGDSLRLAAAGSGIGRLDTKSANDVGKNLGRVLGRGPTGQVRAQVTAKPNTMKVEGHLDRGEIQKVINAHIHELQGCYERQLVVSPNLAGKVSFEWIIGGNGLVTTVKIKASSLSSNEATSCMQAAIRRWQFPAPSGGQVTVIYPVALASSGT